MFGGPPPHGDGGSQSRDPYYTSRGDTDPYKGKRTDTGRVLDDRRHKESYTDPYKGKHSPTPPAAGCSVMALLALVVFFKLGASSTNALGSIRIVTRGGAR